MSAEPFDEILSYLGLGARTPHPSHRNQKVAGSGVPNGADGELRLALRGSLSLWQVNNDNAQWIELRGNFATFRATRPKALLLLSLQDVIEGWANGTHQSREASEIRIRTMQRAEGLRLEIRHKSWKPIRLCRDQARGFVLFVPEITAFASHCRE